MRVNGIMTDRDQVPRETARSLAVQEQPHTAKGSMRWMLLRRAAKA
jgi:hypothetical protein